MRRRAKQILGWCHGGILLSVLAPVLYALFIQGEMVYDMKRVWLLNLLILAVIAGTDLLMERCRGMGMYLFWSILCVTAVNAAAWKIRGITGEGDMDIGLGVAVILGLESFVVYVERILIRLHDKRNVDRQEENPDWQPRQSILTHPRAAYLLILLFAYGVGKFCNNPPLCNIIMGLLPLYLCGTLLYCYLEETQEYLFLNKRVCNLSGRRLYGINGSICLMFLAGIICLGIVSGVLSEYRNHRDIRGLFQKEVDMDEMPTEQLWEELNLYSDREDGILCFMEPEDKEPPAWMKYLEQGLAVLGVSMAALLGICGFHRISRLFRETFDENGDVVENLQEEKEAVQSRKPLRTGRKNLTQTERIRRQYRRTIRKYRKEPPGRHETPYEMETYAGIADTEEGKRLHEIYERVRYHR